MRVINTDKDAYSSTLKGLSNRNLEDKVLQYDSYNCSDDDWWSDDNCSDDDCNDDDNCSDDDYQNHFFSITTTIIITITCIIIVIIIIIFIIISIIIISTIIIHHHHHHYHHHHHLIRAYSPEYSPFRSLIHISSSSRAKISLSTFKSCTHGSYNQSIIM